MKLFVLSAMVAACLVGALAEDAFEYGARQYKLQPTQLLKSYQGFVNDFYRNKDSYRLQYHVGDSERFEERSDSGEVTGTFAFVAPEGNEYEFKYEADEEGYKVEGDALPEAPEDTDDVKAAREAFFEAYEKQRELTEDYDYDSVESSHEEDNEESSEESSEEEDGEGSEEDEEDDDEEEEQEEHKDQAISSRRNSGNSFFSVPYPYRRRS